jgi:hypothetical protein
MESFSVHDLLLAQVLVHEPPKNSVGMKLLARQNTHKDGCLRRFLLVLLHP